MKPRSDQNRQVAPEQLQNRESLNASSGTDAQGEPVVDWPLCRLESPPIGTAQIRWVCHKPRGHEGRCQSRSGYSWRQAGPPK